MLLATEPLRKVKNMSKRSHNKLDLKSEERTVDLKTLNAQLRQEIEERKQREGELEAVVTVVSALRDVPTRAEMPPIILDQLLDLLGADGAALAMHDLTSGEIVVELARGCWAGAIGLRVPPGMGVCGHVIATGQPYVNGDLRKINLHMFKPGLIAGLHTVAGVPLIAQGQTIGTLWVGRDMSNSQPHFFTEEEVRLLTVVGNIAASAIHRATLHEQSQRRARELDLRNRIIAAAVSTQSEAEILQTGCAELARFFEVPQVALALIDETSTFETVVAEYLSPGQPSALGVQIPLAGNLAQQAVIESGQPLAVADVQTHPVTASLRSVLRERGTVSLLIVPILVRGQVVGTLGIDAVTPREFTSEDIRLAQTVGEELGRALETSRLYDKLRTHAAELVKQVSVRTHELTEANERLKELDHLKSKFVSDVSHELRTPVSILKLYLSLLPQDDPQKREKYITTLKNQTNRLEQLIEDILDLSRLESGKENKGWMALDLNRIVEQALMPFQSQVDAAELELSFELDSSLPMVMGNSQQLTQVVTNLVSNAINYTPAGHMAVRLDFDAERKQVRLQVQDNGMGIEPVDMPHLFERFYRGQQVSRSDIRGTGLGLAIVKEIIDRHNGTVTVQSEVGVGSIFRVWFPVAN